MAQLNLNWQPLMRKAVGNDGYRENKNRALWRDKAAHVPVGDLLFPEHFR